MHKLESLLNKDQYHAVTNTKGAFLILAGAGSGKTRVITYKIAHLIKQGISPDYILAVTFTNKAAREMKNRVTKILQKKNTRVLITTFHSLGVRILKKEITKLGYRQKFSIYDDKDCQKLLKDIIKELKLPDDRYDPYQLTYKISEIKMNLTTKIEDENIENIYKKYQKYLKIYNAVDFDDLIKLPFDIFQQYLQVLEKYQAKWKYILVDEYQDTSTMQYQLVKLLAKHHKNISVVGDDDQSIYSWRGANPQNLTQFETDFYPVKEIRLEQNYRSSANILNAANSVIKYNTNRKSKKLWTSGDDGEPIGIYEAEDEEAEANFILQMIKKLSDEGYSYNDIGMLFRMNSQSRPLEEILRENDISYKLIGAMKFFDRPEIRDILGYMRFFSNIDDEISLYRIINNPKRSIGNTTLLALMEHSKETNSPIYSTIKDFVRSDILGKRITPYLEEFKNLVEKYRELIFKPRNIAKTVQALVEEIDYKGKLITELKDRKKIIYRMNNINQLIQSISRYENDPDNFEPNIYEYLQRVSLSTKDDESNDSNSINMMSIHSAKGLEFKVVFIVGVEEGLLPHHKTLMESGNIEEERRLFYVAITRARERLFLSYPKIRIKFNELINKTKSGFIEELPQDILQEINLENELKDRNNFEALLKRWND